MMRWQNSLVLALPCIDVLRIARRDLPWAAKASALLAAGSLLGFLPQMLAWHAIYGQWLARSPIGPVMSWWNPQLLDVLWSSRNGLFAWSPIFIPAP